MHLLLSSPATESPGEVGREGDSPGIRPGHDSVQGAEAAGELGAAEVRRRGHHGGHQVPAGEAGRERAGPQVATRDGSWTWRVLFSHHNACCHVVFPWRPLSVANLRQTQNSATTHKTLVKLHLSSSLDFYHQYHYLYLFYLKILTLKK